jgi:hypothetical protein
VAAALALAFGAPALADAQVPQVPAPQLPDVPVPQVPTPSLPAPETPSLPAPPPPVPPVPAPPTPPVPSTPPAPELPAPQLPAAPSLPSPTSPAPTVPSAPSLPSPGGSSPGVPTPSGSGSGTSVSGTSGPGGAAGAAGAERPGRAGASESPTPSGAAGPEARILDAAARVAAACRAAGRLLAAGVGGSGSARAGFPSVAAAAAEPVGAMAVALLAREHGLVTPAGDVPRAGDGAEGPASVAAALVDLTPRDVSVLAALAVGMLLLAVTALAAYALADGRAGGRRRTVIGGVRAALHDPVRRADAKAVLLLVVVSLAVWSAIAIWLVTRGG